jgi:hypothetical protein
MIARNFISEVQIITGLGITGIIREGTSYLALAVRDMNALFPQFKMTREGIEKLDEYIRRLQ